LVDADVLPVELEMLALTVAASNKKAYEKKGAPYYEARKYLEFLVSQFGLELEFTPFDQEPTYAVTKPYDFRRSALVNVKGSDVVLGMVGEYRASVIKNLKLPRYTAGFEIGLHHLVEVMQHGQKYIALPRFPKVGQDISLRVPTEISYQRLAQFVGTHLEQNRPDATLHTLSPVDIYQSGDDQGYKNVTFRLRIASYDRTMTAEEINRLLDQIALAAKEQLGAERV
jgi:phenylalanyl-tRNA synthetase beta subunit